LYAFAPILGCLRLRAGNSGTSQRGSIEECHHRQKGSARGVDPGGIQRRFVDGAPELSPRLSRYRFGNARSTDPELVRGDSNWTAGTRGRAADGCPGRALDVGAAGQAPSGQRAFDAPGRGCVDPSGGSADGNDERGIVVCGQPASSNAPRRMAFTILSSPLGGHGSPCVQPLVSDIASVARRRLRLVFVLRWRRRFQLLGLPLLMRVDDRADQPAERVPISPRRRRCAPCNRFGKGTTECWSRPDTRPPPYGLPASAHSHRRAGSRRGSPSEVDA
jgi:hypothetical protein